jgi:hypothetical protein
MRARIIAANGEAIIRENSNDGTISLNLNRAAGIVGDCRMR